jgi:hypothetical protein
VLWQWMDGPMSCSCKEDEECKEVDSKHVLDGAAIIWIISELSRLFPARNLVPVP